MAIGTLFGGGSESSGLYGIATGTAVNPTVVSKVYFEWFIFTTSASTPATPTGGSWNFTSNIGTAPAGWFNFISGVPLNSLWFSIAFVDSRNPLVINWSTPGLISSQSVYATAYADVFTGNGSTVAWTLSNDPVVVNNTDVSINGVTQRPTTDYTVSGTTLTTTTAAPLNAVILVKYRQALPLSYYGAASNVQFTPVGALTATNVQAAIAEVVTDLALSSGSSTVGYLPAGTGAVATTVQAKLRQYVSVKDFGAVGDGITNDTAAIQAAITAAYNVYFPDGTYLVNAQINLKSGLMLTGTPSSIIKLASAVTPYVFRGDTLSNIVIENLTILGNGISGFSTIYISNSSNVLVQNCKITKSGATALYFVACSFVKVENCELSENYYYGLEFRDCDGCKAIANLCYLNGNTGVATSGGGRGIMLWRTRSSYIAGNRLIANTEYGFRIYSEAADTTTSNFNVVTGNVFLDNTRVDLVLYDEGAAFSFVANNVISDNVFYRTVDTTDINSVCVLHGDFNTYVNNHIIKSGTFGTDCGFNFYNANYCVISNCSVYNMDVAFSTSSSSNITIDNCFGNVVGKGLTIPTEGIIVRNSKFLHGGAGVTDICIDNTPATGKNFYEGNYISGFYQGVTLGDQAVAIFRNTSVGTTNAGLRKTGNVTSTIEAANNSWDNANPFILSAYTRTGSTHDQAVIKYTGAPTILSWTRGDTAWNEEPAIGQPVGWMCTVAGTPGTWVAMANL